jgi:hypothetical protein
LGASLEVFTGYTVQSIALPKPMPLIPKQNGSKVLLVFLVA